MQYGFQQPTFVGRGDRPEPSHSTALIQTLNLKPGATDLILCFSSMDPLVNQIDTFQLLFIIHNLKRKDE